MLRNEKCVDVERERSQSKSPSSAHLQTEVRGHPTDLLTPPFLLRFCCRAKQSSSWLRRIMLWKMVADSLRGRRRRLPCSLWFLLLIAAGGLVLFIHQRDLSEMALQQGPGKSWLKSYYHHHGLWQLMEIVHQVKRTWLNRDRLWLWLRCPMVVSTLGGGRPHVHLTNESRTFLSSWRGTRCACAWCSTWRRLGFKQP